MCVCVYIYIYIYIYIYTDTHTHTLNLNVRNDNENLLIHVYSQCNKLNIYQGREAAMEMFITDSDGSQLRAARENLIRFFCDNKMYVYSSCW